MRDLNYELAPKPGMTASQRKTELDGARFVSVRNLAYLNYIKADGTPLMTYQETLDNRELVKTAIINYEIAEGLIQNDLGSAAAQPTQPSPTIPQNGAQMSQQPMAPQMSFQPQMQPAAQGPVSPAQFAQMPVQQQQPQPQQQQFAMAPAPQFAQYTPAMPQQQMMQPQMAPQQQMMPQMQMQQMQPQIQATPAAPPMESAPITGKKRKTASGNSVAPPPTPVGAPPGFQQQAAPTMQAAPAISFQPMPATPQFQPQQAQAPQFQQPQVQQIQQQAAPSDLGTKIDMLGKGIEVAANNADTAMKMVSKLQADLSDVKLVCNQMLACLHHMYLTNPQLQPNTGGKAGTLGEFQTYLKQFIANPN